MNLQTEYDKLKGRTYCSLNAEEKQTVYAMEIWNDSDNLDIALDVWGNKNLTPEYIDEQNRNTFEYVSDIRIGMGDEEEVS